MADNSTGSHKVSLKMAKRAQFQYHFGTVFLCDPNIVLRGIRADKVSWVETLLSSGLIHELSVRGLFPSTSISEYKIPGFPLVVEHERVPVRNSFLQWSFDMIKDSARRTIEVNAIAEKFGYQLRDAHPLNTMFWYGRCVFIDLDSFVQMSERPWNAFGEFVRTYIKPLQILSLQHNFEYQRSVKGMMFYLPNKIYEALVPVSERIKENSFISEAELYDYLKCISLAEGTSLWSDYHVKFENREGSPGGRLSEIIKIVNQLSPSVVVDLGANAGEIAKLILDYVASVKHIICIDKDHFSIQKLYNTVGDYSITPVLGEVDSSYDEVRVDAPRGDLVLALALTHHLLLTIQYELSYVFEIISRYTDKYVMIEFMPLGLYGGDINTTPAVPDWYCELWFEQEFLNHYDLIKKEKIETNRVLFVGSIRKVAEVQVK